MSTPYWTNRLARPDDTEALLKLVRLVHGNEHLELNRAYWEWRYLNQSGFPAHIWVAEFESQPIGVLPMAMFEFQRGAQRMLGSMYTGVVTHTAHRRRGIFQSLINSCNQLTQDRGGLFSMGMPNEAALPGYMKFGVWVYTGLIPLFVKVTSFPALASSKVGWALGSVLGAVPQLWVAGRRPRVRAAQEIEAARRVPPELDEVSDQFALDCGRLMLRRSAAYWNWRYCERPEVDYCTLVARQGPRVHGAVVTATARRMGLHLGLIMDIITRDATLGLRHLVRAAEDYLRARGVGLVTCQATSPMLREALRAERYWSPAPERLPKKFHYIYRPTGLPGLARAPDSVFDWHLTFGDSDNA